MSGGYRQTNTGRQTWAYNRLTHLERWQTDKCRNVRWIQTDKHRQTDLGIQQADRLGHTTGRQTWAYNRQTDLGIQQIR